MCTCIGCTHVRAVKCVKLTPAGKQCWAARLGKRCTVHGVNMALKARRYMRCAQSYRTWKTQTHDQTNKQTNNRQPVEKHRAVTPAQMVRAGERQKTASDVRLPSGRPESRGAPCRRISLRWSHRPVVTTSWPPHLRTKTRSQQHQVPAA